MSTHKPRIGLRMLVGLVTSLLVSAALVMPALAAAPNVNTGSGITVDGNLVEWTADDFFADMYRAGDPTKEVESHLYLRYDCDAAILYVGVVAADGVTIIGSPGDDFVKFGNDDKKVDGSAAPPDGTQPEFAYAPEGAGWEASFSIGEVSILDLNVHTQVTDDGSQTSAVADRAIPMTIECEDGGEEELSASLTIVKAADGDEGESFDIGDFSLADGQTGKITFGTGDFTEGEVEAMVAETLTDEQEEALWSLESIDCAEGATFTVDLATSSVTVTLHDGDNVSCTFTNEQGDEGTLGGNPTPSPSDDDELPDTAAGAVVEMPVTLVSVFFLAAVALLFGVRLARQR